MVSLFFFYLSFHVRLGFVFILFLSDHRVRFDGPRDTHIYMTFYVEEILLLQHTLYSHLSGGPVDF